jgi:hypothetical protein
MQREKMMQRSNVSVRGTERYGTPLLRGSTSLRLDAGCPDHLAPFLGFVRDQPCKVGGGERGHVATKLVGDGEQVAFTSAA